MSDYGEHGIGDNNPPPDIDPEKLIDATKLLEVLTLAYKPLTDRGEELTKGILKWVDDHTDRKADPKTARPKVGDEQDLKDTTDLVKQVKEYLSKEVEVTRKKVTGPIDVSSKIIQRFFVKDLADRVKDKLRPVVDAQSLALLAKEQRERTRLREEAFAREKEADRLAIMARRAAGVLEKESLMQRAFDVEDAARDLAQRSEASSAELSRTRTDAEQVTSLRSHWRFEIENLMEVVLEVAAGRLPVEWLTINEVYANSKIRPRDGIRKVPGLRIIEDKTAG